MSESRTNKDILSEYINSANKNKASLAGSAMDQYKNIQDNTLNAKNEAYQAQQNAMKYSENVLKQQGLGNTGFAQSTNQNINNNYMNAINNVNANKLQAENDLLNEYRTSLAGIEEKEKYEADQKNATALSRYESLLPYYMDDENKLAEYMSQIENDATLSEDNKQYIKDYVNAMQIQKDATTDPNEWKTQRNEILDEVKTYLKKGNIEGNRMNSKEEAELNSLFDELYEATDSKEAEAIMEEIIEFVEQFEYEKEYSGTLTANKDDQSGLSLTDVLLGKGMSSSTGDIFQSNSTIASSAGKKIGESIKDWFQNIFKKNFI